jgi:hypothetical protein
MGHYDSISNKDVVKYHLDEDIIPEAVWSIRNSPIHLDRIRDGVESKIYTGSDAQFERPILWTRTAIALWSGSNVYGPAGLLPLPPVELQVASCGGNHAEHKDLDYCSVREDIIGKIAEQEDLSNVNSDNNTLDSASNKAFSPGVTTSSSNPSNQSTSPSSTPTPISNPLSHGDLTALDQCDGAAGVCAVVTTPIDMPIIPIDMPIIGSQAPPIDDLTLPIDVLAPPIDVLAPPTPPIDVLAPPINLPPPATLPPIQVAFPDNPGPGSDPPPFFTPSPLKPIPEASTWVMTIIGFGIMIFVFRKKRRPRVNPISIIDVSDVC